MKKCIHSLSRSNLIWFKIVLMRLYHRSLFKLSWHAYVSFWLWERERERERALWFGGSCGPWKNRKKWVKFCSVSTWQVFSKFLPFKKLILCHIYTQRVCHIIAGSENSIGPLALNNLFQMQLSKQVNVWLYLWLICNLYLMYSN